MEIELRELSIEDGKDVFDFLTALPEKENGFIYPGYQLNEEGFSEFLQRKVADSRGIGLKEGYVPQTMYWLHIDQQIVGIGKLRHYLTEALHKNGGHIGYAIGPEYRGKGYGKILLGELLKKAKRKNISEVLLTCDQDNYGSRAVIEANKGVLEKTEEGKCYYWIKI